MKNFIKKLAVLFFLIPIVSWSQTPVNAPFYITNHKPCDITVHYEVSDCNSNACLGVGVGIVDFNAALVIPTGGTFWLPIVVLNPCCGYPSGSCTASGGDVFVWLKEVDYVDATFGGSNAYSVSGGNCLGAGAWGSGATTTSPASAPGCGGVGGPYTLTWNSGGVDIW